MAITYTSLPRGNRAYLCRFEFRDSTAGGGFPDPGFVVCVYQEGAVAAITGGTVDPLQ
jgi:hypothetical protein